MVISMCMVPPQPSQQTVVPLVHDVATLQYKSNENGVSLHDLAPHSQSVQHFDTKELLQTKVQPQVATLVHNTEYSQSQVMQGSQ